MVAIVWNHFTLSGGCILTVLVGLYEKYWAKTAISIRSYTRVVLALFVFACFQAWQGEHESKIGRESDLAKQEQANKQQQRLTQLETESRIRKEIQKDQCDSLLQASQKNINDYSHLVLGQQNVDQAKQSRMDNCLFDLANLRKQPPFEFTQVPLWINKSDPVHKADVRILLTNQPKSPIDLVVSCWADKPIVVENLQAVVLGNGNTLLNVAGAAQKLVENSWRISIASPTWTVTNPLLVNVLFRGEPDSIVCKYDPR